MNPTTMMLLEAHKEHWLNRLAYWDSQVEASERALEVAQNERYQALVELGSIAVKQMIEDGTLST